MDPTAAGATWARGHPHRAQPAGGRPGAALLPAVRQRHAERGLERVLGLLYTQALALSPDTALVCYEREGSGGGGLTHKPSGCAPPGSQVFCMRLRVE